MIAALGHQLLTEDAGFHWYQIFEAAVRQFECWPEKSEQGALIMAAAARFLAAHTPTRRELSHVVHIATRLRRGEPLYEEVRRHRRGRRRSERRGRSLGRPPAHPRPSEAERRRDARRAGVGPRAHPGSGAPASRRSRRRRSRLCFRRADRFSGAACRSLATHQARARRSSRTVTAS